MLSMIKATIKEVDPQEQAVYRREVKKSEVQRRQPAYNPEYENATVIADAAKYTLSEIGHMPNYVLRRYYNVPGKEIKRWRQESGVEVIDFEDIKTLRDLRLTPEAAAESMEYTPKQVEATRVLYESKYTNLEDKIKYYYVEVRNQDNKLVVSGYLGQSISWSARNTIMKNVDDGVWQVSLI